MAYTRSNVRAHSRGAGEALFSAHAAACLPPARKRRIRAARLGTAPDYFRTANAGICTVLQLETRAAIDRLWTVAQYRAMGYDFVAVASDLGLLVRVQDRRGDIGFTAPPIGHNHPLVCGVCRRVVRFDGAGDLTALEATLAAETGFAIYGHHLEVYGVCAACQAADAAGQGTAQGTAPETTQGKAS